MADPQRIVKAIRKTKRVPTIFSHTDPAAEAQPPPAEEEVPPPTDPPADTVPSAVVTPAESPPENKETKPAETPAMDATVIHTVHGYPNSNDHHMYNEHWTNHPMDMHGVRYEASPYYAMHSYSHHRPNPYIAEYGFGGFPVQEGRYYSPEYYPARGKGDGSHITSMFSDENPNACNIA